MRLGNYLQVLINDRKYSKLAYRNRNVTKEVEQNTNIIKILQNNLPAAGQVANAINDGRWSAEQAKQQKILIY